MTLHGDIMACGIASTYLTTEAFYEKQLSELVKGAQKIVWGTLTFVLCIFTLSENVPNAH